MVHLGLEKQRQATHKGEERGELWREVAVGHVVGALSKRNQKRKGSEWERQKGREGKGRGEVSRRSEGVGCQFRDGRKLMIRPPTLRFALKSGTVRVLPLPLVHKNDKYTFYTAYIRYRLPGHSPRLPLLFLSPGLQHSN